ncbi:MAG: proton-conducting transporter membrane subunit [Desulfuromonadales bacterium]|nr:proton-conducting transporter membrane subunit [Desulfuromonadales bacterium]
MTLLILAVLILAGGSLLALALRGAQPTTVAGILTAVPGAVLAAAAALQVLLSGKVVSLTLPWAVPGGAFALRLDPLAAFFLLPIAVLALFCALYAGAYLRHDGLSRRLGSHWFFFNGMVASMLLVVTAANAVLFLAAWEIMTISSFFLVAWDHHKEEVRKAAWLYLLAAHLGMTFLLALFLLAGRYSGGLNFSQFGPLGELPMGEASALFLLALIGFGVKAGLFPLHIWLPDAHPAAPSHVSAIMSAVLIKTGIYGILRIVSLLPPAPAWWGWLLALSGAAGALYGIALATQQRDIKRCLAYSTVENVGIVFLGLGFGMVAKAHGLPTVALLAFAGGLLHLWNHALFKGVMFLGAGTLLHATGTRDMNRMGGLLRRMPLTGLLWIGGSLAITALPPFNGLVSEWLIYVSLATAGIGAPGPKALMAFLLFGLLGLVGALTLVTFTRLIGLCLLGEPREPGTVQFHEATPSMLTSMGMLLAGCLAIGLYPQGTLALLAHPLAAIAGQPVDAELGRTVAPLGQGALLLLAGLLVLTALLVWLRRSRPQALDATWGCGFRFPSPHMTYSGEGYAELAFRHLLPRFMRPTMTGGNVAGIFPAPARLDLISRDPVLVRLLHPVFAEIADRCQRLRWLQQGQLWIYLFYILIASAVLMAWSLITGGHGGG